MPARKFALIGGIVMLVLGLLALVPTLNGSRAFLPFMNLDVSYGMFLGIFPMNILNKLALIVFGLGGIWAYRSGSVNNSVAFARVVFVVMGLAALLGLFPATNTLGGYWPLYGNEVWMHALFAVFGAYFGFASARFPVIRRHAEV